MAWGMQRDSSKGLLRELVLIKGRGGVSNEPRDLAAGDVSPGPRRDGTVLPVLEGLQQDIEGKGASKNKRPSFTTKNTKGTKWFLRVLRGSKKG